MQEWLSSEDALLAGSECSIFNGTLCQGSFHTLHSSSRVCCLCVLAPKGPRKGDDSHVFPTVYSVRMSLFLSLCVEKTSNADTFSTRTSRRSLVFFFVPLRLESCLSLTHSLTSSYVPLCSKGELEKMERKPTKNTTA